MTHWGFMPPPPNHVTGRPPLVVVVSSLFGFRVELFFCTQADTIE